MLISPIELRPYAGRPATNRTTPLLERLAAWIDYRGDDECWEWRGGCDDKGYGKIRSNGKMRKVHVVMWELFVGLVPEGLELDHLCRVRRCCNPRHLEPVTHAENMRRIQWSHCTYGHPLTGVTKQERQCKECHRRVTRESARRRRAHKSD